MASSDDERCGPFRDWNPYRSPIAPTPSADDDGSGTKVERAEASLVRIACVVLWCMAVIVLLLLNGMPLWNALTAIGFIIISAALISARWIRQYGRSWLRSRDRVVWMSVHALAVLVLTSGLPDAWRYQQGLDAHKRAAQNRRKMAQQPDAPRDAQIEPRDGEIE